MRSNSYIKYLEIIKTCLKSLAIFLSKARSVSVPIDCYLLGEIGVANHLQAVSWDKGTDRQRLNVNNKINVIVKNLPPI